MKLIIGGRELLGRTSTITMTDEMNINIGWDISMCIPLYIQNWYWKYPHLFHKLSKLFRGVRFWNAQTQNSVETLFLSERANTKLFRKSKIFEIDALFMKLEGFLYWSQVLETFYAYLKPTCMICVHISYMQACVLQIRVKGLQNLTSIQKSF